MYSMDRSGVTTTPLRLPAPFPADYTPMKNNPEQRIGKYHTGSATDKIFSGKNDKIIKYIM